MNKPLIGVTGEDTTFPLAWWCIRWALWRCGATGYRLTPKHCVIPSELDGMIISGGDDIDQRLYIPDVPDTVVINRERDRFEILALKYSLDKDLPILGICRGAQLFNIVLGGTLHSDLRAHRSLTSNKRILLPRKLLTVAPQSSLYKILGSEHCYINSLHHQAIDQLGDGLHIAGRDADNIIQAVEVPNHRCRIGVQWHPEYLPWQKRQLAIFKHLVASSAQ